MILGFAVWGSNLPVSAFAGKHIDILSPNTYLKLSLV